jgi:hypothetical protein
MVRSTVKAGMATTRAAIVESLSISDADALHCRDEPTLQALGLFEILAPQHPLSIIGDPIEPADS